MVTKSGLNIKKYQMCGSIMKRLQIYMKKAMYRICKKEFVYLGVMTNLQNYLASKHALHNFLERDSESKRSTTLDGFIKKSDAEVTKVSDRYLDLKSEQ